MKTVELALLLLLACAQLAGAQASSFPAFDYLKAEAALKHELLLDDNWESVVNDDFLIPQFNSHDDVAKNARIKPIAVYELDKAKFKDFTFAKNISHYYAANSSFEYYQGFLTKQGQSISILVVPRPEVYDKATALISGIHSMHTKDALKLYAAYKKQPQAFFYDATFKTYAYFNGASIVFWSYNDRRFMPFKELVKTPAALAALKKCFGPVKRNPVDDYECSFGDFFASSHRAFGQ